MPDAVIAAAVRSPIGRAVKGSLRGMRADDMAAQMIRVALAKVPALDPHTIDDIMLGCAQPAGDGCVLHCFPGRETSVGPGGHIGHSHPARLPDRRGRGMLAVTAERAAPRSARHRCASSVAEPESGRDHPAPCFDQPPVG